MLSHTDLKKGVKFILKNQSYEVLESSFLFKGRGSSTVQAKIRNLITGNIISKTFHPGEEFKEVQIEKFKARFIYFHRDKYCFCENDKPAERFELNKNQIGLGVQFLKPNQLVEALKFKDKIINISLPIKINLKITEAPPGIKGNRAQAGTKTVILETGAKINVPLFIKEGDIIEINSEKGQYVRRIENN